MIRAVPKMYFIAVSMIFSSCSGTGLKRYIANDTTGNPIGPAICTVHLQAYGLGDKDNDGVNDDMSVSDNIKPIHASLSTQDFIKREFERRGYLFVDNKEDAKFQLALGMTYSSHIQEFIWGQKLRTADYEISLELLNSHSNELIVHEIDGIYGDGRLRLMTEERAAKKFYNNIKTKIPLCDK
ncbi:MAG: hypothetical protein VXV96_05660 [Bdellovibrionota bacterium]|nr:hypothetical protein [Bdellovibrionota bacterium]